MSVISYKLSTFIFYNNCSLHTTKDKKINLQNTNNSYIYIKSFNSRIVNSVCKLYYPTIDDPILEDQYIIVLYDHNNPVYHINCSFSLMMRSSLERMLIFSLDGKVLIFKDNKFQFKIREETDENYLVFIRIEGNLDILNIGTNTLDSIINYENLNNEPYRIRQ